MKLQRLMSYARRAIDDYQMIKTNDKIAVGISGGKDSLALLYALAGLRRFYPKPFTLEAITVKLGLEGMDFTAVKELCDSLEVSYTIVETDIAEVVFDVRKEENPCSLCAKMRKGAFNEKAKELGCNKSAYAHHQDDVIETSLMSLIFEGHYYTFSPVTYLDRMDITLIRPLIYVPECEIVGFQKLSKLPVVKNTCPADGVTKREYVKLLIKSLEKDNPGTKDRLFSAITSGLLPNWRLPDADKAKTNKK